MITVYFADLTHTAQGIQAKCMPLGAGLVAAYAKRELNNRCDISLYKLPQDLEASTLEKFPDILCMSNYAWNFRFTLAIAQLMKQLNPQLIIIFGGPNYPYNHKERLNFLQKHDCIDFYIFGEGEIACTNLLQEIIQHNLNVKHLKSSKKVLDNCSYLTNNKKELISGAWLRTFALDQFPCPYLDGLMDKFFDLPLIPLYETTRGCPFSCTFCTDGIKEKNKIFRRSPENIQKSINYISKKIKYSDTLIISDLNFGMYNEDLETAKILATQKKNSGFPLSVGTAIGKSRPKNIMKAVKILDGSLHIGLSFQSTDPEVLKNIKRKNVKTSELIHAAEESGLRNAVNYTEIILALPSDSLSKHMASLKAAVDLGMTKISMFQLMLLTGSDMNTARSREQYGLQTKWRVMANCVGVYDLFDVKLTVAETEEIVTSNNTITFDEYVECRIMNFVIETFVNNEWYIELFELIKALDLKVFDFLIFLLKTRDHFPSKIADIFDSFEKDTRKDLFTEKKDLDAYINDGNILEKIDSGELGNNELLDHKTLCYLNFKETTQFIFEAAHSFLATNISMDDVLSLYLTDLKYFILCRKNNIFDVNKKLIKHFRFDFELISQKSFRIDPHNLEVTDKKLMFSHNKKQKSQIIKAMNLYGSSLSGLGRFLQRSQMNQMYRKVESLKCE